MIRINLLPYRPQRRRRQILQHVSVAAAVLALAGMLAFSAHWYASSQLESLQEEYASLRAQNAALQKKIGDLKNLDALRKDVERKLALVDELQKGRFRSLETLAEISRVIPENVWLTSLVDKGDTLQVGGLGESNKAVANFMRGIEKSPLFSNVRLSVITRKTVQGVPVRSFNISFARVKEAPAAGKSAGKGKKG